jgi:hypothetical protein
MAIGTRSGLERRRHASMSNIVVGESASQVAPAIAIRLLVDAGLVTVTNAGATSISGTASCAGTAAPVLLPKTVARGAARLEQAETAAQSAFQRALIPAQRIHSAAAA